MKNKRAMIDYPEWKQEMHFWLWSIPEIVFFVWQLQIINDRGSGQVYISIMSVLHFSVKQNLAFRCTNLQTEHAGDVGLGQRDAHAGFIGLIKPLGDQLNAQKLVQPLQTFHVEGQQEHHAGLAAPERRL